MADATLAMGKEDLVALVQWYACRLTQALVDADQPRYRQDARAIISHISEMLDSLDAADLPPIKGELNMKIDLDMLK